MPNASKHSGPHFLKRHTASTRAVGFTLLVLAAFNTGQILQQEDNAEQQAKRVEALYVALAQEQAALRAVGQNPTAPDPSTIMEKPDSVFNKNGSLAEGK